jgi:hypothetical protein
MNPKELFGELKRRNVYKVAVAYAVVGWLLMQIASQIFPFFEIPNWGIRLVVLIIALGFPIALIIAWAFELTPEGVKRTEVADAAHERLRGAVWIYIVVIGAVFRLVSFFSVAIWLRINRAALESCRASLSPYFHSLTLVAIQRTRISQPVFRTKSSRDWRRSGN